MSLGFRGVQPCCSKLTIKFLWLGVTTLNAKQTKNATNRDDNKAIWLGCCFSGLLFGKLDFCSGHHNHMWSSFAVF